MKPSYEELEAKCNALAAENAGLKAKGRELLTEASSIYEKFNATVNPEHGDFIDGQTLHEFQFLLDVETTATDAFLDVIRASALPENIAEIIDSGDLETICWQHEHYKAEGYRLALYHFRTDRAAQLRKRGAQ
ncbi:hypothetical protein SedNR2807_32240 [Citrobacter sedlakii]